MKALIKLNSWRVQEAIERHGGVTLANELFRTLVVSFADWQKFHDFGRWPRSIEAIGNTDFLYKIYQNLGKTYIKFSEVARGKKT